VNCFILRGQNFILYFLSYRNVNASQELVSLVPGVC